ncbi:hypothetical protein GCK72_014584 [Caenorhabditis remanei]|uniref:Uncharacterized protein n=1 Tax=Caenorhabditis remanei TaxID=31234 RepID=A0A6A5GU50_CAERE|nr:hypothetical protein GCK72_014584 [Caenorhabditis remanei]KAF1758126.1 hypothetical protein GCK72_014584 [Caenorhabditis remanei]
MRIWLLLLSTIICYNAVISFSSSNNLRWVPPSAHEWKNSNIPKNIKVYWENRWAKSSYLKGCSEDNSLKIIPVYFWPGERVDLPCKMCQMSYLMNGRMKRWGYSEQIDEFLLNPTQFVRVNEIWKDVQNTQNFTENKEDVDSDNIIWYPHTLVTDESDKNPSFFSSKKEANFTSRSKEPPRFWQNDGKLTIFGADVRSQGVYFCYDEISRKQTVIFFVLIAMVPPVRFTTKNPLDYTDHCGNNLGKDSELIFPSHNWRFHFLPMGDFNPSPTCQLDETDSEGCKQKYSYLDTEKWPKNFAEDCSMDRCRARLYSPDNNIDLYIELRWDEFTSCKGDQPTKRREGHCYLVRGGGSINIESMKSEHKKLYSWIKNLETVFDRKPFDVKGIRLHSSLLTSAIFEKPKITGCYNKKDEEDKLYKKYDQVWRHVFLPTLGVPENGAVVQLGNPFESCIRYTRLAVEENKDAESENLVGTFSTQVDYC